VLYIYSADGQLKTTVKFRRDDKILIEYLSDQTAKLQLSYALYNTNFPGDIFNFNLAHHTNGALALVSKKHLILLQKPSP
jgi:hypothetical protein